MQVSGNRALTAFTCARLVYLQYKLKLLTYYNAIKPVKLRTQVFLCAPNDPHLEQHSYQLLTKDNKLMKQDLTTTLHFHYQACENGST